MKERPILFNDAMVRAVLSGRKTQTRRLFRWPAWAHPASREFDALEYPWPTGEDCYGDHYCVECPIGSPGDALWVREAFNVYPDYVGSDLSWPLEKVPKYEPSCYTCTYRADNIVDGPWRPSIHMPRWASRITLEIIGVRFQRLQKIRARDAWAEGVNCDCMNPLPECFGNVEAFRDLWDSIYAGRRAGWDKNPWVWVVEFHVAEVKR